jgi:trigger factor
MQVEELPAQGLQRSFKLTLAAEALEAQIATQLAQIGKTAKMDGFRPGKVPQPVLVKRYGEAVREDVIEKAAKAAVDTVLKERNLRPAMAPQITLGAHAAAAPVAFTVEFEVLPEVAPGDFSGISLQKYTAHADASAVDAMIERMAKSARQPQPLATPRAAQAGDVLVIDFAGSSEGKPHAGMQGTAHRLELGSKSFIDGFEEQLIGAQKAAVVTVNVTFPAAYHAAELAGKPAEFIVTVQDILHYQPLVLDDALAGDIGFSTMTELRDKVRERMQAEYDQLSREVLRRQLLDQLADAYDFAVPNSMVDAEFQTIWEQVQDEKARGVADAAASLDEATQKAEYRGIAERRVRLGLLLAEVGRQQKITIEQTELRDALIAETRKYPGQEQQVFEYFTKTPGALDRLRAPILEEKVVDYVVAQTKVTTNAVSPEELRALPDTMDAEAEAKVMQKPLKKSA